MHPSETPYQYQLFIVVFLKTMTNFAADGAVLKCRYFVGCLLFLRN